MVMADKPKAPVKVGFYDIEKTIGKGNFAVVKLARHRITKTEVGLLPPPPPPSSGAATPPTPYLHPQGHT